MASIALDCATRWAKMGVVTCSGCSSVALAEVVRIGLLPWQSCRLSVQLVEERTAQQLGRLTGVATRVLFPREGLVEVVGIELVVKVLALGRWIGHIGFYHLVVVVVCLSAMQLFPETVWQCHGPSTEQFPLRVRVACRAQAHP